jgi:hypothetical protein
MEEFGTLAGFVLTLFVFSYLLGDNFLYRIAIYIFVGLSAAYVTIITVEGVLLPLVNSDQTGEQVLFGIAGILTLLLLLKVSRRFVWISNMAIAFLIAIGTAVSIVGAVTGTLVPFSQATGSAVESDVLEGIILFIGVSTSLIYFQYLARRRNDGTIKRPGIVRLLSVIGQGFIAVTLGALYASAILTSLTVFSERLAYMIGFGG